MENDGGRAGANRGRSGQRDRRNGRGAEKVEHGQIRERERSNEGHRAFAQLNQEEADAALARTLQEQAEGEDRVAKLRHHGYHGDEILGRFRPWQRQRRQEEEEREYRPFEVFHSEVPIVFRRRQEVVFFRRQEEVEEKEGGDEEKQQQGQRRRYTPIPSLLSRLEENEVEDENEEEEDVEEEEDDETVSGGGDDDPQQAGL